MNLCIAIRTYNRVSYLKRCIEAWNSTKNNLHNWRLIVADDGSKDGTIEYCESIPNATLIRNRRRGYHYQTNTMIKAIDKSHFDVCFSVDDDVFFKKAGWDDLYLEAINESGYDHLVFHEDNRPRKFIPEKIKKGKLETWTDSIHVLGCLYTITQEIIDKVGYFDIKNFGLQESGHIDYTRRCCQAGFNCVETPFDAAGSNDFIGLSWQYNDRAYSHSLPERERNSRRSKFDPILHPKRFVQFCKDRAYIPFQETKLRMECKGIKVI